jgi:glyceraldehyde 3-phosphate dehydrogenase
MEPTDLIMGAASCTTNAIVPVLKVLDDEYGVESGHIESVHSYTNDQNLIDNFHKKISSHNTYYCYGIKIIL